MVEHPNITASRCSSPRLGRDLLEFNHPKTRRSIMGQHGEKNHLKDAINVLWMDIALIVIIGGFMIASSL